MSKGMRGSSSGLAEMWPPPTPDSPRQASTTSAPLRILQGSTRGKQPGVIIQLDSVRPMWLEASKDERYLLLEDVDTGDVLMPLMYLRAFFDANYSRKLSSLKHRVVNIPSDSSLAAALETKRSLYWQWAFESPLEVKAIVRKQLGEDNMPQGHLRLILLPIVYNAVAQKPELREAPFLAALRACMQQSSYWPFLRHRHSEASAPELHTPQQSKPASPGRRARSREQQQGGQIFSGPRSLEATALKYMYMYREGDVEPQDSTCKRLRPASPLDSQDMEVHQGQDASFGGLMAELQEQKRRCTERDVQVQALTEQLNVVKAGLAQLYGALFPAASANGPFGHHAGPMAAAQVMWGGTMDGPPEEHTAESQAAQQPKDAWGRHIAFAPAAVMPVRPIQRSSSVTMASSQSMWDQAGRYGGAPHAHASGMHDMAMRLNSIQDYRPLQQQPVAPAGVARPSLGAGNHPFFSVGGMFGGPLGSGELLLMPQHPMPTAIRPHPLPSEVSQGGEISPINLQQLFFKQVEGGHG